MIEIVTRARMRAENLRHRSVAIIVRATDGRLLVHRRADDKDLFPGWWDLAAGGVVGVGEASDDAAARELAEELGLTGVAPVFLADGAFEDQFARERCRVYHVVHDGPYRFDDGEITEARLVGADELTVLMRRERFLPGSIAILLPLVSALGTWG